MPPTLREMANRDPNMSFAEGTKAPVTPTQQLAQTVVPTNMTPAPAASDLKLANSIPTPQTPPVVTNASFSTPAVAPPPAPPVQQVQAAPKVEPPKAPPAAKPDTEYKVKSGDNLWNIAKKHYGLTKNEDIAKAVETIANRNGMEKGADANNLKPFNPNDPKSKPLQLPPDWKGKEGQKALDWSKLDGQTQSRQGQAQGQGRDVNRAYNPDTDGPLKDGRVRRADGRYYSPDDQPREQPRQQRPAQEPRAHGYYSHEPRDEYNRYKPEFTRAATHNNTYYGRNNSADLNGDGRVTRREKDVSRYDQNGDGRVSTRERYDRNGDGVLSRKEQVQMQRDFDRAARNDYNTVRTPGINPHGRDNDITPRDVAQTTRALGRVLNSFDR